MDTDEDAEPVELVLVCLACREPIPRGYGRSRGILHRDQGHILTATLHLDCAIPDGWIEWR